MNIYADRNEVKIRVIYKNRELNPILIYLISYETES